MKALSLISTGVLLLLLGAVPPTYAQEEKHEQEAKPQKQEEQAKPQKQEQAKPAKQERQAQAKPEKQEQAKPAKQEKQAQAKPEKQQQAKSKKQEHVQQVKGQQPEQAQGQWARNGQKDSRGHEYNESRFGRDHHARFEENVVAFTTAVGSTPPVDTGSMLESIRSGFTSRRCTSLWGRTGYGMQLHTTTLL